MLSRAEFHAGIAVLTSATGRVDAIRLQGVAENLIRHDAAQRAVIRLQGGAATRAAAGSATAGDGAAVRALADAMMPGLTWRGRLLAWLIRMLAGWL